MYGTVFMNILLCMCGYEYVYVLLLCAIMYNCVCP